MGWKIFGNNKSTIVTSGISNSKVKITTNGKSVQIIDNKIIIDGKDVTPDSKVINLTIEGDVQTFSSDVCSKITINGNVNGDLKCSTGDVDVKGHVSGNVKSDVGEVQVYGGVGGNVKTDVGDINIFK